jgi:hypothetical protein
MTPLISDLQAAIAEVLVRHNRPDLEDSLVKAVSECVKEPADDSALVARICALFHASPVDT